jgi:hypothetical protein
MKKRYIVLIITGIILFILFVFGSVLGSFDFTRSKRIGKTNFYLVEGVNNVFDLHYKDAETNSFGEGIIDGRITDIYWNEQYILLTQYAVRSDSVTGYYIVKMLSHVKKGVPWKTIKLSTKEEYEQKKQELSLNEKEMKHIIFR